MATREEIREGIANHLRNETYPNCNFPKNRCGRFKDCAECEADSLIPYLHSQGLEIVKYPKQGDDLTGTHIVWSEPLIKEVSNGTNTGAD